MKDRKLTNKRKYQIEHSRNRAQERLGINLSKKECERISHRIRSQGDGVELVGKVSFHLSVWRVELMSGHKVVVVYDKVTNAPVTIMTEELLKGQKMYKVLVPPGSDRLKEGMGDNAHLASELAKVKVKDD